jgi:hypothetical protein
MEMSALGVPPPPTEHPVRSRPFGHSFFIEEDLLSSSCPECGGVEVERNGKLEVQHDRDCDIASDPETICNSTVGLADILVPTDLGQMSLDAERAWVDGDEKDVPEFHITALVPPGVTGVGYIEIRGRVGYCMLHVDADENCGITMLPGFEAVVYKMDRRTGLPDDASGVDISSIFTRGKTPVVIASRGIAGVTPDLPQVHRIHKPSAHVPVTTESETN